MRDENAGLLPTKKALKGLNAEDLIDIETMTDYLNSIECLSV
jgi:hypothetical protein